jgi:ACS family tartrate transporter-like MFS transporter
MEEGPMVTSIERQTMKKVYLRLLPFCFVLYFICYLDRVNIWFAALTMNKELGLSSYGASKAGQMTASDHAQQRS